MTERERTATRTEGREETVVPGTIMPDAGALGTGAADSNVEVFDTNSASAKAGHSANDRMIGNSNRSGYADPEHTTTPHAVDPGTNWNRILIALTVIIVFVLLLYWLL